MLIKTNKDDLASPLSVVLGAADTKGTVPILGMVLLKTNGSGSLSCICSDCGVLARALSPCEVKESGEIAVDARSFNDLIKAIPDKSSIEIKTDAKGMQIRAGRSRFKLPTLDASDYPRIIQEKGERITVTMDSSRLAAMVDEISLSMASADVRVFLNGALFRIDAKGLWLVSTDGNRLVVAHEPIPATAAISPREVIVPRKTVLLAKRMLGVGQVKLTIGATDFQLILDDATVLLAKSIVGNFPDWRRVIPTTTFSFSMNSQRLTDSLTMISASRGASEKKDGLSERIELVISENMLTIEKGDTARCELEMLSASPDGAVISLNINWVWLFCAQRNQIIFNAILLCKRCQQSNFVEI